ncbi:hypothetical protein SAMN04487905_11847 [Actinopolyspora xinjiangensis]|uniref:Ferritin-like domain-containing protein n=1 Tax=Actinopolyspora xinjiangensis TaxID=405564 RepID=A0A1H0WYG7_9ACTN|nr:hypothetical protein SAMN04487905_11847 [Actinopolyspora xinjiangensis]
MIRPEGLYTDEVVYRLFTNGLNARPWKVSELLSSPETEDPRTEVAWKFASRGYYAEQAGLVTAAALAAETDDLAYRFDMATAASDEARHADAFLRFAQHLGGDAEECFEMLEPLDEALTSLPYPGKVLAHTVLEGFAADEFHLFTEYFKGHPAARIYEHVRHDENRHVAMGVSHLARACRDPEFSAALREHGDAWLERIREHADVTALSAMFSELTGKDPADFERWFTARHRQRMASARVVIEGR